MVFFRFASIITCFAAGANHKTNACRFTGMDPSPLDRLTGRVLFEQLVMPGSSTSTSYLMLETDSPGLAL